MSGENCLFCRIYKKDVPTELIYEDDHAAAFLDVEPRAPGHLLVVPKMHAERIGDLPDNEIGPFFLAVKLAANMVVCGLEAHGATIGINQGEAAGQVVGHLHIHIIPRFYNDGGGSVQSVVSNKPKESLAEIRDKILKTRK